MIKNWLTISFYQIINSCDFSKQKTTFSLSKTPMIIMIRQQRNTWRAEDVHWMQTYNCCEILFCQLTKPSWSSATTDPQKDSIQDGKISKVGFGDRIAPDGCTGWATKSCTSWPKQTRWPVNTGLNSASSCWEKTANWTESRTIPSSLTTRPNNTICVLPHTRVRREMLMLEDWPGTPRGRSSRPKTW